MKELKFEKFKFWKFQHWNIVLWSINFSHVSDWNAKDVKIHQTFEIVIHIWTRLNIQMLTYHFWKSNFERQVVCFEKRNLFLREWIEKTVKLLNIMKSPVIQMDTYDNPQFENRKILLEKNICLRNVSPLSYWMNWNTFKKVNQITWYIYSHVWQSKFWRIKFERKQTKLEKSSYEEFVFNIRNLFKQLITLILINEPV